MKRKIGKTLLCIGWGVMIVLLSIKVVPMIGTFAGGILIALILMFIGSILYNSED